MKILEYLVLALFLLSAWIVVPATGFHTAGQCAQFGQANMNTVGFTKYNETRRPGPWTIGAKLFDARVGFLDYAIGVHNYNRSIIECPYVLNRTDSGAPGEDKFLDFCVSDDEVQIRTYAVEQDGKVMNGWLHFEVELIPRDNKIIAIYVQIRDEYFNAIGEFVNKEDEHCPAVTRGLATPTEYTVFPCSAVGLREAKVSTALYLVDGKYLLDPNSVKFLPKQPIDRGIHFTWRLHEYWCNRHLRIRPEAIILTEKTYNRWDKRYPGEPLILRKAPSYWIHHGWYGAADIKLPLTTLTCDKPAIDYPSGTVDLHAAPWLTTDVTKSNLLNDYIFKDNYDRTLASDGNLYDTIKSCQINIRLARPNGTECPKPPPPHPCQSQGTGKGNLDHESKWPKNLPSFAGRCNHHFKKEPGHDVLQGCNLDETSEEFREVLRKHPNMQTYSNYTDTLFQNRTRLCSTKCVAPTKNDIADILKFNDTSDEFSFGTGEHIHTFSRNQTKVEKFFVGRKYHAVTCIIWSMFLLPVGSFTARYLKETCMKLECTGIHFWFWVHLGTSLASVAMFITSLSALASNIYTWGRAIDQPGAAEHRAMGYISIAFFAIMLFIGGLRGLHMTHRLIMATMHSAMGFMIYVFNLMAMLFSCFIRGSPAMDECDENGDATGPSKIFVVILVWMIVDVVLHAVMSFLQFCKDRSLGIHRPWWCPIFPVIEHDSADDMIGSALRKIMLLLYSFTCFIFTNTASGMILDSSLSDECKKKLEPLSCKEVWGCSPSARTYAQVVAEKAEVVEGGSYVFELLFF